MIPLRESGNDSVESPFVRVLEPFHRFWSDYQILLQPRNLARFIRSGGANAGFFISFFLGALFLVWIIEFVAPPDVSREISDIPLLSEFLLILFYYLFTLLWAVFFHYPLKALGGRASFKHSVSASLCVGAAYLPIVALLKALSKKFTGNDLASIANLVSAVPFILTLSYLHRISKMRATAGLFLGLIAVFLTAFLVAFTFALLASNKS